MKLAIFRANCMLAIVGLSGCPGDEKGTALGTHNGGPPDCLTANQSVAGWTGSSQYQFLSYNFSCQGNPTSEEFYLVSNSFNSGAGLSAAAIVQDMATQMQLWDAAAPGITLTSSTCNLTCTNGPDDDSVVLMLAQTAGQAGTLAVANRTRFSDDSVSCDITLYTHEFTGLVIPWSTGAIPSATGYSTKLVLMHEIGHCLGMEHPASPTLNSIMEVSPAGTSAPSVLDADDAQAAAFVYP